MEQRKIEDLLNTVTRRPIGKESGRSSARLAQAFRRLLADRKIGQERWSQLMTEYVNKPRNGAVLSQKSQTDLRGRLATKLGAPDMTWDTFCTGLELLQIEDFELTVFPRLPVEPEAKDTSIKPNSPKEWRQPAV